MRVVLEVGARLGVAPTCHAFGLCRATYYRGREPRQIPARRRSVRALSEAERGEVMATLNAPRFADLAPA